MAAKEGMQMDESGTGFAQEASLLGIPAEPTIHCGLHSKPYRRPVHWISLDALALDKEDESRSCSAQLLCTCKIIHQEAKPILYQENIFVSKMDFLPIIPKRDVDRQVRDREPDISMIPEMVSGMVGHLAIVPHRIDPTYFTLESYQLDMKPFISPSFANLRSLRLRLHAWEKWHVDSDFRCENWQTSARELSIPEWKDVARALLSRNQPPEIRIVVWLIRPHLSKHPVLARRFCYIAERKIGTQDEVALNYVRRISSNDGLPPQETADEWTERSWEPNPIITALLARAAQLPELNTAIMKKRYQKISTIESGNVMRNMLRPRKHNTK